MDLPQYIDREAWEGFCEMRKAKGKRTPFTERAAKMILKTLQDLKANGHDPNAALDQSTVNGWSDVYEPRDKGIQRKSSGDAERTQAFLAERDQITSDPTKAAEALQRARTALRRVA